MKQIIFEIMVTGVDMLAAGVFALPGALLLAWGFARLRKKRLRLADVGLLLFELYLCAMFSVVGLPGLQYIRFGPECNLIPLLGMVENRTAVLLTVLNVALFVPLGLLAPVLWPQYSRSWRRLAGLGFGVSLLIELVQLFNFRLTDVDDLIANTAGALLGLGLWRLLPEGWRHKLEHPQPTPVWAVVALAVVVIMVFAPIFHQGIWELIMG